MGDRWRHRPVSSLLGWWLTSLVRSITTEVVRATASVMTLEYLTALQGLPRLIVDAEELQQQAEREFQNPGRWGLTFPTSSAGACVEPRMLGTQT
jgi:hypothetical protein